MELCSRCGRRKAKRHCPALGSALCTLCCGQARNKDIHCPDSCPVLAEHRPYQQRRAVERAPADLSRNATPDILRDERLAWLAYHAEYPLRVYGQGSPALTDAEAVAALEYARDKTEKAGRLLVLPGESLRPRNELGEAVVQSLDNCRYEGILLIPGGETYTAEERIRVLDAVLAAAKELAQADPAGRNYLTHLIERFARVEAASRSPKPEPSA
jgi:hypothetical protein